MEEKDKDLETIKNTTNLIEQKLNEYCKYKKIGEVSAFRKLKENSKYPDVEYGYLTPYEKELGLKDTDWCIEARQKLTPDRREEDWSKQRQIYGFDAREVWNLDVTICAFLYNRLRFLQEYYFKSKNQDDILTQMIEGFGEYLKSNSDISKTDKAFKLLADYYKTLWI